MFTLRDHTPNFRYVLTPDSESSLRTWDRNVHRVHPSFQHETDLQSKHNAWVDSRRTDKPHLPQKNETHGVIAHFKLHHVGVSVFLKKKKTCHHFPRGATITTHTNAVVDKTCPWLESNGADHNTSVPCRVACKNKPKSRTCTISMTPS